MKTNTLDIDTQALRQRILNLAMRGKLVEQDPNDEPASMLLEKEHLKIPKEKPHVIPSSWQWIILGSAAQFINGRAYKKKELLTDNRLTPVLRVGNLFTNSSWYYSDLRLEPNKYIDDGDLIYAWSASFGPRIWNGGHVIFHYHIWKVELSSVVNKKFLYYFLSDNGNVLGETDLHGSTMKHITKTNMENLAFPLPPLPEQKRIAAKIDQLFTLIQKIETSAQQYDELKTALKSKVLDLAMRGKLVKQDPNDEPAGELLKQIEDEKAQLIKEKKIKKSKPLPEITGDEKPFDIPDSWEWVRFNDIFNIQGGSQPPKSKFLERRRPGTIRLFQIRDYGEKPVPVYIQREYAKKKTIKGDILLARYGGSLGKVFWAENGAYNVALAKIIYLGSEKVINKKFLFFFFKSALYQTFIYTISRSAQAGFNKADLNNLLFPLPPLSEQKRIVAKIGEIFAAL